MNSTDRGSMDKDDTAKTKMQALTKVILEFGGMTPEKALQATKILSKYLRIKS
jgi:hypothetical protein